MAANEYYNPMSNSGPQAPYPNSQQPYPPSYVSQPPSRTQSTKPHDPSVSPFEAPFDDHVYPMGQSQQRLGSHSTIGGDTAYYGQGGDPSNASFHDGIPLQNQKPAVPPKTGIDHVYDTDHVYEAGDPNNPQRRNTNNLEEGARDGRFNILKKRKKIAFVTYIFTTIQIVVFIVEIVKNAQLTGSPIMIHPQINPMIGPSPYVTINMGARYPLCMHNVKGLQDSSIPISFPCPDTIEQTGVSRGKSTTAGETCTLQQLCGMGFKAEWEPQVGKGPDPTPAPNQWFRFITPIFLHAGIIHIGFNMLLQMTLGKEMEVMIGPIRYFLVYMASGIFGFVLGGNFAGPMIPSTGASGALFGILALVLLDLLYHWQERTSPWKDLAFIMLDVLISFALGLLPGLDNFSHIGGFFMGITLGICILHSPAALQKRIGQEPPYEAVAKSDDHLNSGTMKFAKAPVGFFKGRKPAWWAWWLVRVAALVFVLVVFIILMDNFYKTTDKRSSCSWCHYFTCIDVNGWCEIGNLNTTTSTVPAPNTSPAPGVQNRGLLHIGMGKLAKLALE